MIYSSDSGPDPGDSREYFNNQQSSIPQRFKYQRSRIPNALPPLHPAEKVSKLECRRLRRIRSVRRVALDRLAKVLPHRAGIRLRWIRRPHRRPPLLDGVGRLEREQDAWTGRHEVRQTTEEWTLPMHGVEAFSLGLRQMLQPHGLDRESGLFDPRQNLAGQPAFHRVRLDDRKRLFHQMISLRALPMSAGLF